LGSFSRLVDKAWRKSANVLDRAKSIFAAAGEFQQSKPVSAVGAA
jgi:hypothetical protein